ncbi:MAG: mannose-sensitive hemagglutinin a [Steroidobacteraceae bacterium]|nr:mannose-sensitive hemagglutinin a [Steroidobacteraceae bacterium]
MELIVVIVILGILAAVALPKFMGLEREARIAAVKSMGGTVMSAAQMAHGVCMARNCANGNQNLDGNVITFVNGYPNNATIVNLIQSSEGFTRVASRFTKAGATTTNCWVQYNQATLGANGIVTPPTLTYNGTVMNPNNANSVNTINTSLRNGC